MATHRILPCRGIRDDDAVVPLAFCCDCQRWRSADKAKPDATFIGIALCDLTLIDGRLGCAERVAATTED